MCPCGDSVCPDGHPALAQPRASFPHKAEVVKSSEKLWVLSWCPPPAAFALASSAAVQERFGFDFVREEQGLCPDPWISRTARAQRGCERHRGKETPLGALGQLLWIYRRNDNREQPLLGVWVSLGGCRWSRAHRSTRDCHKRDGKGRNTHH